jgi:hypothetical protein
LLNEPGASDGEARDSNSASPEDAAGLQAIPSPPVPGIEAVHERTVRSAAVLTVPDGGGQLSDPGAPLAQAASGQDGGGTGSSSSSPSGNAPLAAAAAAPRSSGGRIAFDAGTRAGAALGSAGVLAAGPAGPTPFAAQDAPYTGSVESTAGAGALPKRAAGGSILKQRQKPTILQELELGATDKVVALGRDLIGLYHVPKGSSQAVPTSISYLLLGAVACSQ